MKNLDGNGTAVIRHRLEVAALMVSSLLPNLSKAEDKLPVKSQDSTVAVSITSESLPVVPLRPAIVLERNFALLSSRDQAKTLNLYEALSGEGKKNLLILLNEKVRGTDIPRLLDRDFRNGRTLDTL